jgi:hypothetical protein
MIDGAKPPAQPIWPLTIPRIMVDAAGDHAGPRYRTSQLTDLIVRS